VRFLCVTEEAIALLHDSFEFARCFPDSIVFRPTFVALRVGISFDPSCLAERSMLVEEEYQRILRSTHPDVRLLGAGGENPKQFCKVYSHDEAQDICRQHADSSKKCGVSCLDCFLVQALAHIEGSQIQWPCVMAWEPGISFVRVGATLETQLSLRSNVSMRRNTDVVTIARAPSLPSFAVQSTSANAVPAAPSWCIGMRSRSDGEEWSDDVARVEQVFDVVINCAGGDSARIDNLVRPDQPKEAYWRELKACYVLSTSDCESKIAPPYSTSTGITRRDSMDDVQSNHSTIQTSAKTTPDSESPRSVSELSSEVEAFIIESGQEDEAEEHDAAQHKCMQPASVCSSTHTPSDTRGNNSLGIGMQVPEIVLLGDRGEGGTEATAVFVLLY
jgi:hypothetical protein